MSEHQATPEQWKKVEDWAVIACVSTDSCLLELRARVEALEAQANHFGDINKMVPPPVATDEELIKIWNKTGGSIWEKMRASYNLGIEHGQTGSQKVADPAPGAGGLVERVANEIAGSGWKAEARAAILEVARWLREQGLVIAADLLEQEAGQ